MKHSFIFNTSLHKAWIGVIVALLFLGILRWNAPSRLTKMETTSATVTNESDDAKHPPVEETFSVICHRAFWKNPAGASLYYSSKLSKTTSQPEPTAPVPTWNFEQVKISLLDVGIKRELNTEEQSEICAKLEPFLAPALPDKK